MNGEGMEEDVIRCFEDFTNPEKRTINPRLNFGSGR